MVSQKLSIFCVVAGSTIHYVTLYEFINFCTCLTLRPHHCNKPVKEIHGIVRSRGVLRVVLNREHRLICTPNACYRIIIQVNMCYLHIFIFIDIFL